MEEDAKDEDHDMEMTRQAGLVLLGVFDLGYRGNDAVPNVRNADNAVGEEGEDEEPHVDGRNELGEEFSTHSRQVAGRDFHQEHRDDDLGDVVVTKVGHDGESGETVSEKIHAMAETFGDIEESVSHGDCGYEAVHAGQRALTQEAPHRLCRPRQCLTLREAEVGTDEAPVARHDGMQQGQPIDAQLLPQRHADSEQQHCCGDSNGRQIPFLCTHCIQRLDAAQHRRRKDIIHLAGVPRLHLFG
mmetsp:Transcript_8088/g.21892  ORF Transcript_8088/g.21892 Transcript_8088/m.21892 type:complete len:244 (-) Transcript_8088:237-968(-)